MAKFRETVADMMEDKPRRIGATRRPIERVLKIHRAIREGGYPNCTTLAKLFEVTPKTIQRDLDFMRDSLCIEIDYDSRRHGYHTSEKALDFPGFVMAAEDFAGLFLTRTALDAVRGTSLESTMRGVFGKLLGFVEGDVNLSWTDMEEVFTRKMPEIRAREVSLFGELADAVVKRREIGFHYLKLGADKAEARAVRPYHLGEVDGAWYLIGHDIGRDALRTFALPRVSRLKFHKDGFERPADFDGRAYLRRSFGIWNHEGNEVHLVIVRLKDYAARLAQERRWHPSQETRVLDDLGRKAEVRFQAGALEEVVRWVLSFGSKAEVVGPPELKRRVKAELKLMTA